MSSNRVNQSSISVDALMLYIARGCLIMPCMTDMFLDQIEHLDRTGKICLTPNTIFALYHRKLQQKRRKSEQIA